jgi:hypothetical protein
MTRSEETGWIDQRFDAILGHIKAANFIRRAKAILHGTNQTKARMALTFKVENNVDQVFE